MLAAEAAFEAIAAGRQGDELSAYPAAFEKSWLYDELNKSRNFKSWFKKGLVTASIMNGLEQFVLRGNMPWTLHRDKPDHAYLKPASECKPIVYPKTDGKLTFDRLSSVFISGTNHAEDQPAHLTLKDAACRCRSTWPSTPAPSSATARQGSMSSWQMKARRQRPAPADQCAKLRALQDLRHQGPDPEHCLGHARRRGGPNYTACKHRR
ncbi:4Fe-4S dicluster domain-containing protein [Comamonas sp. JC664]|uniref:4Fe-4S dicluster domain-containing protein n=1 Tax=Comamonas sp. JC664 TaxID=2801917 RepID=UPI0036079EC0